MKVLHKCDTPACVNYERDLFLGLDSTNTDDKIAKGRLKVGFSTTNKARGANNGRAKLTQSQADEIRLKRSQGYTWNRLRIEYNISQSVVRGILTGVSYRT